MEVIAILVSQVRGSPLLGGHCYTSRRLIYGRVLVDYGGSHFFAWMPQRNLI